MSIFGDLDINEIPDDPFYTPPNTYHCVCTEARFFTKEGETIPNLIIKWTIDEPLSDFHGNNISEWFKLPLHPEAIPRRKYEELEGNEKKTVISMKKRLRRGFDLTLEEVNAFDDPEILVSREAKVTTKEKGEFINVVDAVNKRLWDEEHSTPDAASESMGL